jgi:hypothetical protein
VAEGFHQENVGSIETGKLADIVLLTADPLQNILNTRKVDTVIKDGKVIDRGYHSWFAGSMFRFSPDEDTYDMVDGAQWAGALKAATLGRNRGGNPRLPEHRHRHLRSGIRRLRRLRRLKASLRIRSCAAAPIRW